MNRLSVIVSAWFILTASPMPAQKPDTAAKPEAGVSRSEPKSSRASRDPSYPTLSPGEVQATPEMWFYEQEMRQYLDPDAAVRRAAEFRADQRARRLETMRWYGLSNQRPRASSDPYHNEYSPRWTSNHSHYPTRWVGVGEPWIVVRPNGD